MQPSRCFQCRVDSGTLTRPNNSASSDLIIRSTLSYFENSSPTSLSVHLPRQPLTPEGVRRPGVVPLNMCRWGAWRRRLVVLGRSHLGCTLRAVVHGWPWRTGIVHRRRRRHALHVVSRWVLLVVARAVVGVGALRVGVARIDTGQLGAGDEPLWGGRGSVHVRTSNTMAMEKDKLKRAWVSGAYSVVCERHEALAYPPLRVDVADCDVQGDEEHETQEDRPLDDEALLSQTISSSCSLSGTRCEGGAYSCVPVWD